jgi:quinol monooxygenase YgiN
MSATLSKTGASSQARGGGPHLGLSARVRFRRRGDELVVSGRISSVDVELFEHGDGADRNRCGRGEPCLARWESLALRADWPKSGTEGSMAVEGAIQRIQVVEFETTHPLSEVRERLDAWVNAFRERVLQMFIGAADHSRPNHYWLLLEWPSREAAESALEQPETKAALEEWKKLLAGEPVFRHLDVFTQLGGPAAPPVDSPVAGTPGMG